MCKVAVGWPLLVVLCICAVHKRDLEAISAPWQESALSRLVFSHDPGNVGGISDDPLKEIGNVF